METKHLCQGSLKKFLARIMTSKCGEKKSDVVGYIYAKSLRVANTSIMHFKCDMNLHVLADVWQVRTKDIYPCFFLGMAL